MKPNPLLGTTKPKRQPIKHKPPTTSKIKFMVILGADEVKLEDESWRVFMKLLEGCKWEFRAFEKDTEHCCYGVVENGMLSSEDGFKFEYPFEKLIRKAMRHGDWKNWRDFYAI